jgi:hypothetical protein
MDENLLNKKFKEEPLLSIKLKENEDIDGYFFSLGKENQKKYEFDINASLKINNENHFISKNLNSSNKEFKTPEKFKENERTKISKEYPTKPNLIEKLTMGDIEYYYKFGKFPFSFFIQLLLVISTTHLVLYNFYI